MRLLFLLFALGLQIDAYGQLAGKFESSEHLLIACKAGIRVMDGDRTAPAGESGICVGYMSGFLDGMASERIKGKVICIPEGVTLGQTARVIVKHLQDHPNTLHLDKDIGMQEALAKAYPCK